MHSDKIANELEGILSFALKTLVRLASNLEGSSSTSTLLCSKDGEYIFGRPNVFRGHCP